MYKVLTGKLPLESVSRLLTDSIVSPSRLNAEIPEYVSRVIMKTMAVVPEERYQNIAQVRQDLLYVGENVDKSVIREEIKNEPSIDTVLVKKKEPVPVAPVLNEIKDENTYGEIDTACNSKKSKKLGNKKSKSKYALLIVCVLCLLIGGGIFCATKFLNKTESSKKEQYDLQLPDTQYGDKVYIYTSTGDIENTISLFREKYPEYSDRVQVVYVDYSDYIYDLDSYIEKGREPDILMIDGEFIKDSYSILDLVDLEEIGLTEEMYANAFPYTKNNGTDNGTWKTVTTQCTPGVFVYNKAIARKVLGTDVPEEIEKKISDWDDFLGVAEKMKNAGYYMLASQDEMLIGNITNDSSVNKYQSKMNEKGYCAPGYKWTDTWVNGMINGGVFGYFGCSWFPAILEGYESTLEWNVCMPPVDYYYGGTYIGVTRDCCISEEKKRLAALLLYTLTCDEETMIQYVKKTGDFANNKKTMKYINDNVDISIPVLSGQNPIPFYLRMAEKLDK